MDITSGLRILLFALGLLKIFFFVLFWEVSLISLSLVVVFSVMLLLTVTVFMHRSTEMFVNVFDTRFCFEY